VLTTAALNEYVMLELLAAGRWRKHLDRLQQKLGAARAASTKALRDAGVLLHHPGEGGLFLWGAVPHGVDVDLLVKDAYRNDILLVRGATFSADPQAGDPHIRFNAVYSQHTRLADYLKERFAAVARARSTLDKVSARRL
jgi:DNA-binding transcriptional MocR family regulator